MAKTPVTPPDAGLMYRVARAFKAAAETVSADLFPETSKSMTVEEACFMAPVVTLQAISLELHLKCLVLIDTGEAKRGHELSKTFGCLTAHTQSRVNAEYLRLMALEKVDELVESLRHVHKRDVDLSLRGALAASEGAFQTFRYFYEGNADSFTAPLVADALNNVILERRPDLSR